MENKGVEWVRGISIEAFRVADYRGMKFGGDMDFSLQVLRAGLRTRRTTLCDVDLPPDGSNAGGMQAQYKESGGQLAGLAPLVAMWPGVLEIRKRKDGTIYLQRRWENAVKKSEPESPNGKAVKS
jgi:hypothetical protein